MKTVYCPVKNAEISGGDCLLVCDIADRIIKPDALPHDIKWDEHQRQKCKDCKYHEDVR